jgi:hypothetical protein
LAGQPGAVYALLAAQAYSPNEVQPIRLRKTNTFAIVFARDFVLAAQL